MTNKIERHEDDSDNSLTPIPTLLPDLDRFTESRDNGHGTNNNIPSDQILNIVHPDDQFVGENQTGLHKDDGPKA